MTGEQGRLEMNTQPPHERQTRTEHLEPKHHAETRPLTAALKKDAVIDRRPTESQKRIVLTGFLLSIVSLLLSFFPLGGIPIAVTAILMSRSGRHISVLRTVATWGVALAIFGLLLATINICITLGIYIASSIWR